jgi:hypothetical protein
MEFSPSCFSLESAGWVGNVLKRASSGLPAGLLIIVLCQDAETTELCMDSQHYLDETPAFGSTSCLPRHQQDDFDSFPQRRRDQSTIHSGLV